MTITLICRIAMVVLAAILCPSLAQDDRCEAGIIDGPDMSNNSLAATDYQLEPAARGEIDVEDEEAYDDDFDVREEDTDISAAELRKLESQTPAKSSAIGNTFLRPASRGKRQTSSVLVRPWPFVLRDCPSWWRWGCPIRRTNLGCFRNGPNELCCPLWPNPIRTGYCRCRNCVVLKPRRAECGRCIRKFRMQRFWARCRRINPLGPWFVRQMSKAVAHRCCCARRGTNQCI